MGIFPVLHHNPALAGHHAAVTGNTGSQYAVEHIHAPDHCLDEAVRRTDAHQVPGLLLRHMGHQFIQHFIHDRLRLAHAQAADAIADEVHIGEHLGALHPQVLVERALHNAEQRLVFPGVVLLAPFRPAVGDLHVLLRRLPVAGIGRAHVKRHGDVGTQRLLDIHGLFRADKLPGAVQVALEGNPFLLDLPDSRKGEYLESAAVRQDRAVPAHELVQAARFLHQGFARPQVQVVGVGQQDLGADLLHFPGRHRLHAGAGTHRHIDRRGNISMRRVQHAQPRAGLLAHMEYFITEWFTQGKSFLNS